jgi:hypothetical protein
LERGLDAYAATPNASEAELAAQLRKKIERYWESISPSLRWSNRERRASGLAFYSSAILPNRVSILEITTEIDGAHLRQWRMESRGWPPDSETCAGVACGCSS